MPPALTSWTLAESVGLTWPEQVLTHPLDGLRVPDDAPLCVRDDAGGVSAAQRAGDHLFYAAALPAHARRRFDLVLGDSDSLPVHVAAAGDYLELSTPSFGIRIAWTEEPVRYAESRPVIDCPPPVSQIHGSDRTWVGRGGWRGEALCRGFRCETVMKGPLVAAVRQTYDLADGPLTFTYRLDAVSPCVQIDVAANRDDLYAVWHFDDYTPTHAFWRPHSTEDWRGKKSAEDHHRQVYTLGDLRSPDTLFLQPFYSWNRNGAMFWSCWDEPTAASDVLVIGATRPSQTRSTGAFRPHQVRDGQQLHIAVPNGRSSLSMGMQKRAGRSRPRTLEIETLYRQMHGLDLDAYAKMTLHWPAMAETRFPRLFIGPEDLDPIRKTARQWPWFCEAFDSRVRDGLDTSSEPSPVDLPADPGPSGRDPAGAYLVSGDAAYARQAFCQIDQQLTHWVQSLGALGPTVDALIGFAFSQPFRATLIAFDFIADALTAPERLACLAKIAFLTSVLFLEDAWPDTPTGPSRGNMNFHASVVSARGLGAALLEGHPAQGAWLSQNHGDAAAFLRQYHFDSGCGAEALTYQFNTVAQFTMLSIALHRAGASDLFETEPAFKRSFDFLASVQTPRDPRVGFSMLPTVGHVTSYGWSQSLQTCFAWAAKATASRDASFSERMTAAWIRAGSPAVSLHDFYHGQIWWPPLCFIDRSLKASSDPLRSGFLDGLGAVFRSGETNGYLLVKMGASRGHYDPDEGSILWYAWGKPVLADFGCQYNPNIECAWLHNRISFDHWNEAGGRAFDARVSDIGPFATMISGSMRVTQLHRWADRPIRAADFDFRSLPDPHAIPPVTWRREVLYIRACEAVLIRDQIDGDHPTDWNLQVFADAIEVKGNHAACRGQFGVDLDVYMGQPEEVAWSIGSFEHIGFDEPRLPAPWWRGAAWTAPEGAIYGPVGERALSLHLPSARRSEYVALLIARPQACRPPTVKPFRDGFSWQTPRASWRAVLTDGSWQIHASQTT